MLTLGDTDNDWYWMTKQDCRRMDAESRLRLVRDIIRAGRGAICGMESRRLENNKKKLARNLLRLAPRQMFNTVYICLSFVNLN